MEFTPTTVKTVLDSLTALAALIAAFLWLKSATVVVPTRPDPPVGPDGYTLGASIEVDGTDFVDTVKLQSKWNARAAFAATAAAFLQMASAVTAALAPTGTS